MTGTIERMRGWRLFFAAACFSLLLGCGLGTNRPGGTVSVISPDFFGIGEDVALQLAGNLRRPLGPEQRIILTTFVNIDDLYETSRFGRTLAEAVSTRMFRHGFGVVEIRKASDLQVKIASGELLLSRDASLLADGHAVDAVVVGTYALTPDSVIVNARMLNGLSEEVLSVAGLEIQRSRTINNLLAARDQGLADPEMSAYER